MESVEIIYACRGEDLDSWLFELEEQDRLPGSYIVVTSTDLCLAEVGINLTAELQPLDLVVCQGQLVVGYILDSIREVEKKLEVSVQVVILVNGKLDAVTIFMALVATLGLPSLAPFLPPGRFGCLKLRGLPHIQQSA